MPWKTSELTRTVKKPSPKRIRDNLSSPEERNSKTILAKKKINKEGKKTESESQNNNMEVVKILVKRGQTGNRFEK